MNRRTSPGATVSASLTPLARTWMMFLTSALWTVMFCYIFTRGYEGKGVMEGARYGLLIAVADS